jgi:ferrous iron transport protein B
MSLARLGREHGRAFEAALALREAELERDDKIAAIDNAQAQELLRNSYLGRMGVAIEPAVRPLGWDWRIGVAAIASFPAREVVIAVMGTVFGVGEADETSRPLKQKLLEARREDGTPLFTLATGLSLMVFFALCCQCAATLAVMRRETQGWKWPLASFVYMTGLAYVVALATFQIARALGG